MSSVQVNKQYRTDFDILAFAEPSSPVFKKYQLAFYKKGTICPLFPFSKIFPSKDVDGTRFLAVMEGIGNRVALIDLCRNIFLHRRFARNRRIMVPGFI